MLLWILILGSCLASSTSSTTTPVDQDETESDMTRKVLGSSVVTSVSVIMDTGNGSQAVFSDAAGKLVQKPAAASHLASPINLLNPDRYEFYTFDDSGDLVKRLMSIDEIQGILASGDGEAANYNTQQLENIPKKDVNDILNNVQNVLRKEIETHQITSEVKPVYDTPDVSSSWSMILPAIFGNSGDEIQLQKPQGVVTPDTITLEDATVVPTAESEVQTKTETTNAAPEESTFHLVDTTENQKNSLLTTTLSSENKIREGNPIETEAEESDGDRSTTSMEGVDAPIIQVLITEKHPEEEKLQTNSTEVVADTEKIKTEEESTIKIIDNTITTHPEDSTDNTPSASEPSTLQTLPPPNDLNNLHNDNINDISLTSTETSTRTKPTETIILILSTIKKETTTLSPTTFNEVPSLPPATENHRESISEVVEDKTSSPAEYDDIKESTISSEINTADKEREKISTVIYEPVQLFTVPSETNTVTVQNEQAYTTNPLTTDRSADEDQTISYQKLPVQDSKSETIGEIHSQEQLTTAEASDIRNNELLSTTTELEKEATLSEFSLAQAHLDNSENSSSVETATKLNTSQGGMNSGFNDGNIIQAVDDLISQIMGINQTTIEYSSTPLSTVNNNEIELSKIKDESRTEPDISNVLKVDEADDPEIQSNVETVTNNYITTPKDITEITTFNDVIKKDHLSTLPAEDNVNPEFTQSTEDLGSTTIYKNPSTVKDELTTVLIDDKSGESLETSEDNNSSKGDISFLLPHIDHESKVSTEIPESFYKQETTENDVSLTTLLTATGSDINYKEGVPLEINNSGVPLQEHAENQQASVKQEQDNNKLIKEEESTDIDSTFSKVSFQEQNNSSEIDNNDFVASPISINDLLSTTPTNNYKTSSSLESKPDEAIEDESLYVRITAAPINGNNGSSSTITLNYKSPGDILTPSKRPIEVRPVTVSADAASSIETTWKLISTISPPRETTSLNEIKQSTTTTIKSPNSIDLIPDSTQGYGLEETTAFLDTDIYRFTELCNELSFSFWSRMSKFTDTLRSIFLSPFATTSMLAMVFLGARGATSGEMNEVLKLDDMVTFNPHAVFKNVTDTIEISKNSGVVASVILRELYSDKNKGKLLSFYKERVRHFYDGHVEEVNFTSISDIIRRRTNLLVKRNTWGKIHEYLKDNSISARPPLAAITASIFQTDCSLTSTSGRDGELHFVFAPTTRQRKLVPIPAAVWQSGFLAGYDPNLDATAVSIGTTEHTISTIFVIPGQQGIAAPGDGLSRLEERLTKTAFAESSWSRLLRSLIPRPGLEVQIPRFAHRSTINTTLALEQMGLKELFSPSKADLQGLNGFAHEMFLSDLLQVNYFVMCGEDKITDRHYFEEYPVSLEHTAKRSRDLQFSEFSNSWSDLRDYQRAFDETLFDTSLLDVPLPLRPRQARVPDTPRLRFDRPFLYFVRHNPTGLILHMGRFNPRLYNQ